MLQCTSRKMCIQQRLAWYETKWAEYGGPLMRLKWNQIPIHARQEACVIQDGRPAENSTHSARAHTPGHNGRQLTNREWEKHSEMSQNKWTENRKLQQISADSIREDRNGSSCGRVAVITEARMRASKVFSILHNQTNNHGLTTQYEYLR